VKYSKKISCYFQKSIFQTIKTAEDWLIAVGTGLYKLIPLMLMELYLQHF
jgi:hypothetical protein